MVPSLPRPKSVSIVLALVTVAGIAVALWLDWARTPRQAALGARLVAAEAPAAGATKGAAPGVETIWVEAEHLDGIRGYCWPAGQNPRTDGNWGLSGPGWAAEWTQGGESNFLSIACGANDDRAVAGLDVEIPVAGTYRVWVRYRDAREASDRFQVRLTQDARAPVVLTFGQRTIVEDDNEMKLYWGWAFAWEGQVARLNAGKCRIELLSAFQEKDCRQVDCLVLTTDTDYRPRVKERPPHPNWAVLDGYSKGLDPRLEPLARRGGGAETPEAWRPRTFRDRGFLYLWNMTQVKWAGDSPRRVLHPYNVADPDVLAAFEAKYAGARDVPIFSDPRIVPTFHGSGPTILATDAADPKQRADAAAFVRWLETHPDRPWAQLLNYAPDASVTPAARANFLKYRDRFVGGVSGENLGYVPLDAAALKLAAGRATTRRELAAAFKAAVLAANTAKHRTIFGRDWPGTYREVIPCQSIDMTAFAPLCFDWGARTVGYESAAITSGMLGMRMAFLRGAARQNGGIAASYRSCNFGDSSTIFSVASSYTKPQNVLDNYYSVYSGAGMTWYKMDIWYQYMAGSGMFFHEQGFDEYWRPGGGTAGLKEVQLSPKGKLVDRFLRVTARHPDRGVPVTPVAFLLDFAHGWDPAPFQPHAFGGFAGDPSLTRYGDHERMLRGYFWTAYHPIGPKATGATDATNEVYVPGVFGDVFDVVYAYPDVAKWTTIDTYPVVVAAGDIALTGPEGERLAQYVRAGGTLLVADGHLSGPGVSALELPALGASTEASAYTWEPTTTTHDAQRFRYRPITGGRPLAAVPGGGVCCAAFDRGRGRLIVLSVPRGLGIDQEPVPILPRLFAHLTRGLMPVEVRGEVEWMVNRTRTGWVVTLLNPAGQSKSQQGITPTDGREDRAVVVRTRAPVASASDWLFPDETLAFSDWEYWVRFLAHSHLGYNDLPLVKYRIHSSNMSIGIDPSLYLAHEIAVLKSLASKAPNLAGSLAEPRYRALIHLQLALKLETAGERALAKSSLQDAREVDPAFVPDPGDLTDLMKMNRSHQIVKIGYFGLEEVARGRVRRGVFLIAKTSFMSPRPREKLKWLCCAVLAPFVHTKQLGRLPSTPITFKQVWEILRHGRIRPPAGDAMATGGESV